MASNQLPRSAQAPPEVPDLGENLGTLATYLRTFSLWCRHGFANKLDSTTAQPGIMIQATDAATGAQTPFSYLLGVEVTVTGGVPTAPTGTHTPVPLGIGKP